MPTQHVAQGAAWQSVPTSRRKQLAVVLVVGVLVLCGTACAYYYWYKDRDLRRITALQQQLLEGKDLSRIERNAIKTQLMRSVDEMDSEKRRELQRDVFRQQRERMLRAATDYHQASATERVAILDRELEQWQRSREAGAALLGGGLRGGGMRGGGGRQGRGPGNRPPQNARENRPDRDSWADRRNDRSELTDEQRTQFAEYMQALQARAEERGIGFELRGNGPPRRGGRPNDRRSQDAQAGGRV